MDYPKTEYPALLASLQPEQAIAVLTDRVSVISKINSDIADWLQERRKIEETYAAGLRKLARRPQQDGTLALGVFQMPWQRIVSSVENLAQSHETLAVKIETDVEAPLRQFASKNREMQAVNTTQGNLASIAKEMNNAQRKADKLNAKGSRKAEGASSSASDTSRQWESQAPYVFEQLQALDETRTNHLRDVLTQFQTHEVDQVERNRASAESCLNALLNIETADEIRTFAARVSAGRDPLKRRRSSAGGSTRPATSTLNPPPTPPPPRLTEDRGSQRTSSSAGQDRLAPLQNNAGQKSKLSGLKRFGTVLNRRKSEIPPVPPTAAEKRKERTRSFAPFRRGDSSRSFHDLSATAEDVTPTVSQEPFEDSQRPQATYLSTREEPLADSQQNQSLVNGTSQIPDEYRSSETRSYPIENPQALQNQQHQASLLPITATAQEIPTLNTDSLQENQRDPSFNTVESDEASRNLLIRDQPIQEDEGEAQKAMNNMATQLRMQAQNSGLNRVPGSVRGRRDVRNTIYVPSTADSQDNFSSQSTNMASPLSLAPAPPTTTLPINTNPSDVASPIKRSAVPGILHEEHGVGSDSTSIHSARSLAAIAHHPELHEAGLNASIVETVNTWFTPSGVQKSFVVGEIALAYNSSSNPEVSLETIRLHNFQVLEKVAANPTFVTQMKTNVTSEEQAGCYTVSLAAIRRPMPTVGLKYQLHLEDSDLTQYSPVLLTPAWQILENQVSVILIYKLNPVFANEGGEINLKNVTISVNLDTTTEGSGKPSTAMMAPTQGASFRRKAGAVVWRFNDLAVKTTEERLLVRFMIQGGPAKQGGVEVKFELPGRVASSLGVEKMTTVNDSKTMKEPDPFADEAINSERGSGEEKRWDPVPTSKMLISGRYSAS